VHTHCRPGSDCGLCDCARFRARVALGEVLRAAVRNGRAALAPVRAGRPQHV
jgi:hypothetical protein